MRHHKWYASNVCMFGDTILADVQHRYILITTAKCVALNICSYNVVCGL